MLNQPLETTPHSATPRDLTPDLEEQIPTPCLACGAPMRLHTEARGFVLSCSYCESTQDLPQEAQARVAFLRDRLRDMSLAKLRLEGFRQLFASPDFSRTQMLRAVATVLMFVVATTSLWFIRSGTLDRIRTLLLQVESPEVIAPRLETLLSGLITPYATLTVFTLLSVLEYHRFHTKIRPLLVARPASAPGGRMRCRCCGGPLPAAHDALVDCRYCGAQNILTGRQARRVALEWERSTKDDTKTTEEIAQAFSAGLGPWAPFILIAGMLGAPLLLSKLLTWILLL